MNKALFWLCVGTMLMQLVIGSYVPAAWTLILLLVDSTREFS